MSAGKLGGAQMMDDRYRGPDEMFGSGLAGQLANNVIMPAVDRITGGGSLQDIGSRMFDQQSPPGYQQPPGEQAPPQGQQDSQQYYQQMRQNIDGMNEAFKQIEQMQMPGGQYQGGGRGNYAGSKTGKGTANF